MASNFALDCIVSATGRTASGIIVHSALLLASAEGDGEGASDERADPYLWIDPAREGESIGQNDIDALIKNDDASVPEM